MNKTRIYNIINMLKHTKVITDALYFGRYNEAIQTHKFIPQVKPAMLRKPYHH